MYRETFPIAEAEQLLYKKQIDIILTPRIFAFSAKISITAQVQEKTLVCIFAKYGLVETRHKHLEPIQYFNSLDTYHYKQTNKDYREHSELSWHLDQRAKYSGELERTLTVIVAETYCEYPDSSDTNILHAESEVLDGPDEQAEFFGSEDSTSTC